MLDTTRIFAQTKFNGDGVVPEDSADDAFVRSVIADVIACLGAATDRGGKPGVTREKVVSFFEQTSLLHAWWKEAEASADILPLGERTAGALEALVRVEAKVEDYFTRCTLAAFDPRAAAPLNRAEADWLALSPAELSPRNPSLALFPLARVEVSRPLPIENGLNPAWADAIRTFRDATVTPVLGARSSLTEPDFAALRKKLEPFRVHLGKRPSAALASLPRERVDTIVASKAEPAILTLIEKDEALRPRVEAMSRVEKLLRYKRDLHRLLCNFVNFRDFYLGDGGIFQCGTLYLDERSCDLCVRVKGAAGHAEVAAASEAFLVYCECTRRGTLAPPST